jgi:hypothetical protein
MGQALASGLASDGRREPALSQSLLATAKSADCGRRRLDSPARFLYPVVRIGGTQS